MPYAKATLSKTNMEPEVTVISIADSSLTRSPIGFRLFHSFPQAIHAKVSAVSCVAHCMASCPSWWRLLPVDQVTVKLMDADKIGTTWGRRFDSRWAMLDY